MYPPRSPDIGFLTSNTRFNGNSSSSAAFLPPRSRPRSLASSASGTAAMPCMSSGSARSKSPNICPNNRAPSSALSDAPAVSIPRDLWAPSDAGAPAFAARSGVHSSNASARFFSPLISSAAAASVSLTRATPAPFGPSPSRTTRPSSPGAYPALITTTSDSGTPARLAARFAAFMDPVHADIDGAFSPSAGSPSRSSSSSSDTTSNARTSPECAVRRSSTTGPTTGGSTSSNASHGVSSSPSRARAARVIATSRASSASASSASDATARMASSSRALTAVGPVSNAPSALARPVPSPSSSTKKSSRSIASSAHSAASSSSRSKS
eukprot:31351-Pelagococcus_subviridis.AAC.13